MPSCVINCCKNNSCFQKKSTGITFHKFPSDIICKEIWIRTVRDNRNDAEWLPSIFSVVCSLHFEEVDIYNTKGGYCRIKKKASPKKIHYVNSEWCHEMEPSDIAPESSTLILNTEHRNIKEEVDAADNFGSTPDKLMENISKPQDLTSNYEREIRDSEEESIFDSSNKNKLRHQARKYKLRCKIHARKIKTLKQKVKRLKKKNATLKAVLQNLKEKNYIDTNLFNMLGENIVATEICHHINKKKLGMKKLKYSPAMKKFT